MIVAVYQLIVIDRYKQYDESENKFNDISPLALCSYRKITSLLIVVLLLTMVFKS